MHWPGGQKVKDQSHVVTKTVTVTWLLVAAVAICCCCRWVGLYVIWLLRFLVACVCAWQESDSKNAVANDGRNRVDDDDDDDPQSFSETYWLSRPLMLLLLMTKNVFTLSLLCSCLLTIVCWIFIFFCTQFSEPHSTDSVLSASWRLQ